MDTFNRNSPTMPSLSERADSNALNNSRTAGCARSRTRARLSSFDTISPQNVLLRVRVQGA